MLSYQLILASAGVALAAPTLESLFKRSACQPQAAGVSGYAYNPDTADDFAAASVFSSAATSATDPTDYTNVFTNLAASNNANDYRGYYLLDSYDVNACAQRCNNQFDCKSFNILFERDPSVEPGTGCDDPSSVTYVKCVLWAGPVSTDNAVNVGFTWDQFKVIIAGSNGYVSNGIKNPDGYTNRQYFGAAAISNPNDQVGDVTFQGAFDANKCAQECTGHTQWAADKPTEKPCNFFNTYYQYVNDGSHIDGQVCVLYAAAQDASKATNVGQYNANGDHVLIADSYGWSVASN